MSGATATNNKVVFSRVSALVGIFGILSTSSYNTGRILYMKNNKNIALLITPSWVVNFVAVSIAVLLTGAVIVLSRYQGSELRQQIFETQQSSAPTQSQAISTTFTSVGDYIANNKALSNMPLLFAWACAGLLVYFLAISIAKFFGTAVDVHDELEYVHVSRQQLLREALLHLTIRVAAMVGWLLFIELSLKVFVPYALACANIAAQSLSITSVGYGFLAAVVLCFDVYLHAVFLRLIFLRPRLFGAF
jgi:hypothetical protein